VTLITEQQLCWLRNVLPVQQLAAADAGPALRVPQVTSTLLTIH